MSEKGAEHKQDKGKTMSIYISGHPVRLSFAKEPDTVAAQRVRNCLIDSYIRQNAGRS